jgi:endonuclease YncB( thermonuclease family)
MELCIVKESEILQNCTIKTPKWSFEGRTVTAKCVKVYDGDTATFAFIPYPNSKPCSFSCRFLGYNSAEIKTKDAVEKAKGLAAKEYLSNMILNHIVKLELGAFDKYGRILVEVYLPSGFHVNSEMLRSGHGKEYHGVGVKSF